MKLNPEQRLIVYIALLWAYENKEEDISVSARGHVYGFSWATEFITEGEFGLCDLPELLIAWEKKSKKLSKIKDESGRLSRINLLEKAIEETARKIWEIKQKNNDDRPLRRPSCTT